MLRTKYWTVGWEMKGKVVYLIPGCSALPSGVSSSASPHLPSFALSSSSLREPRQFLATVELSELFLLLYINTKLFFKKSAEHSGLKILNETLSQIQAILK